jgi:palmitoyl-protein thioesterase
MKSALILTLFMISFTSSKHVARWIHGLGSNCILESGVKRYFKGMDIACIETGAGYISSFESQYNAACSKLEKEVDVLKGGFTLMGFSQGGLLARAVLQRCSVGQYIRRLVTFGGPHSGVAIIPFTSSNSFMNKTVLRLCFYPFIENIVGPCGYIRSTKYYDSYHTADNFIADLNNEFELNEDYIQRLQSLDVLMTVQFLQDQMVQPYNTSTFGYYKDDTYEDYVELEDQEIYTKDKLGLKEINESGKMFRCDIDGDHLQISEDEMVNFAVNVANLDNSLDDIKKNDLVGKRCRFV